ncbi:methionine--tRNA ligase [Temperatibacter marinus]|uniref:Methionine--tRNA ligase n=1 Tax=Temperatibacter marinus TaxID=1456591 RepID=A0AA52HA17_9PROT|nr:methionine--tRNA ligase [Temperatibacter marinus]WND02255.1 methionine--tRNA ligase [Temperatibacter marinus]
MSDQKNFYITTPIYYVNDVPHIGHAYTTLACDVLARFKRLSGYNVMFLTGTDEHGQKVEKSALAAEIPPQEFCDNVSSRFNELASAMNFSNDQFIRTTEDRHKKAVQHLWKTLEEKGFIYADSYAGWYSVRDEAFYAEKELIEGEGSEKLAPTGAPVEWVEEPSYFFKLSAFEDQLIEWYETSEGAVQPKSRLNEVKSFVKGGLEDLSISRTTFSWGVPVPGNDKHIMYVWIDALTNYLTAIGYPDMENEDYKAFWPADVHMVGKDILRFHAVYWPAFLMAADLPLPKRVFAHGWWTNEGQKISKSLGNVIDPFELIDSYSLDAVRYFLLHEVPFGNDGDFSRQSFVNRSNAALANGIGNFAQRSLSMVHKNCDGKVPQPGEFTDEDKAFLEGLDSVLAEMTEHMDNQAFHKAFDALWKQVTAADGYISTQEPWKLKKADPQRMETVLYICVEAVRQLSILMQPIMPDSCAKMLDQMSVSERGFDQLGVKGRMQAGTAIPKPEGVYPRFELPAEE